MTADIRVLLVDDHPVVRQGVIAMLREYSDRLQIVGEASDPVDAMAKAKALMPDIVLTDLMFSGSTLTGIDIAKELGVSTPSVRCVVMTSNTQSQYLVQAFTSGVKAFLYKDCNSRDYLKAIEAVFDWMTYYPPELAAEMDKWNRLPKLTASEERLLPYLAMGLTSKEVAREYNHLDQPKSIESRTIDQHKSNIKQKFNIDSSGGLVAFAIRYCDEKSIDYRNLGLQTKRSVFKF